MNEIITEYQSALTAYLEAQKNHLNAGHEVRKSRQRLNLVKTALFNLEHDLLQEQENEQPL